MPLRTLLCTLTLATAALAGAQGLVVAAASSLTDAFEEIAAAFEADRMGARVTLHVAGSATLLTQIRQGAPFDVFASANEALMHDAATLGLLGGDAVVFARNTLVVATPIGGRVASLADLATPSVRLVLAGEAVPAGAYARALLAALEARYGDGYARAALANVVSEEPNVRQVALRVALGEADAGIVYATDTRGFAVATLPIDPSAAPIALYPAAALEGARDRAAAQAFVDFLRGPTARAILARHGFGLP